MALHHIEFDYPYKVCLPTNTYQMGRYIDRFLWACDYQTMDKNDFHVILVDDTSDDNTVEVIKNDMAHYNFNFDFYRITKRQSHFNCCISKNVAYRMSDGIVSIITSVESFFDRDLFQNVWDVHQGRPWTYVAGYEGKLSPYQTDKLRSRIWWFDTVPEIMKRLEVTEGHIPENVPEHQGMFCSVVDTRSLQYVRGMDEDYKDDWGWVDDDMVKRMELAGVNFEMSDKLFTIHQWHDARRDKTHNTEIYNRKIKTLRESEIEIIPNEENWGNEQKLEHYHYEYKA